MCMYAYIVMSAYDTLHCDKHLSVVSFIPPNVVAYCCMC